MIAPKPPGSPPHLQPPPANSKQGTLLPFPSHYTIHFNALKAFFFFSFRSIPNDAPEIAPNWLLLAQNGIFILLVSALGHHPQSNALEPPLSQKSQQMCRKPKHHPTHGKRNSNFATPLGTLHRAQARTSNTQQQQI